jgi:pantothenate synthetase
MSYDNKYIRNQERIKTRALAKILKQQKSLFISELEKENKYIGQDLIEKFLEETKKLIPDYLLSALPTIMKR